MKKFFSKTGTLFIIITVLTAVLWAYLNFYVSSPTEPVNKLFNGYDNLSLNEMIECLDPATERAMKGLLGIFNFGMNIGAGFGGVSAGANMGINMPSLIDALPLFAGYANVEQPPKANVESVKVISITSKKLPMLSKYMVDNGTEAGVIGNIQKSLFLSLGNLIGDEAVVEFSINDITNEREGPNTRITGSLTVKNYGKQGWRIPNDTVFNVVEH